MPDIKKPEANPIVAALLVLIFHLGHFLINGQQRKWLFILVVAIVSTILLVGPLIMLVLSIIDAFQTAERLQKGETIGENEYTFEPLYKLMSFVDKTATFKTTASA